MYGERAMIFKKKPSGKKVALVVLNVILSVIFVALLSLTVYVEWILGKVYHDPSQDVTLSSEQIEAALREDQTEPKPDEITEIKPEDMEWAEVEKVESSDHIFNVLLVGQDRRPGEIRARSDTMILVTINTKDLTITMTSFMRDLFVQIPTIDPNRLNVPYVVGGFELLADTLELNFGIRPDRYVEVDFAGFEHVINAVGGIDVELTPDEVAYFNRVFQFNATPGVNHLNAEQALNYARCRSVEPDADFSRTRRQRAVVAALIKRAKELNLAQINDLVMAITEVLTTNLTSAEIMSYVVRFYPMIDQLSDPAELRIPYENNFYSAWADGIGAVIVPDLAANSAVIAETQK